MSITVTITDALKERAMISERPSDLAPARRKKMDLRTVSHTLKPAVAETLRTLAFNERVSESAIVEFALERLFEGPPERIGQDLKAWGATARRRAPAKPD
jgi:hypothetical protein